MLKKISVLFLLYGFTLFLNAGMLENFEADIQYLWTEYESVQRQKYDSEYRREYKRRSTSAQDRAYKLQMTATEIGILEVNLSGNLKDMLDFMDIDKRKAKKIEQSQGSRWFFHNELQKQIKKLKDLKFSYETRTFTRPQNSGPDVKSSIKELEKQFKDIKKSSLDKTIYSQAMVRKLYETKYRPFCQLATKIAQEAAAAKLELSEDYNLLGDIHTYQKAMKDIFAEMRKQEKDKSKYYHTGYRKPGSKYHQRKMSETADYRKAWETLDMALRRIEKDIDILKAAGFDSLIQKKADFKPMRDAADVSESIVMPEKQKKGVTAIQRYWRILDNAYNQESNSNGVSQKYYDNFKRCLPPRIANELDNTLNKNREEYEDEFARGNAVFKIYAKYRGHADKFSKNDLTFITNLQE